MPRFRSRLEGRLWLATATLYALVCGTIYPAPYAINFLRHRNLLRLTVALILVATMAALAGWIARQQPRPREWALLGACAVLYSVIFWFLPVPQERLHFLEYGAIAALAYAALRERRRAFGQPAASGWRSWVWGPGSKAILLTAILGWGDEGIQALVPNRYYDLRDVFFNTLAAVLAVTIAELRRRVRGQSPAADRVSP
jgi:VanZ like protein